MRPFTAVDGKGFQLNSISPENLYSGGTFATSDQIKKLRRFIEVEGYKNIVFERVSSLSKTKKMISSSVDPIVIINDGKHGLGKKSIENICSKYDESICSSVHSLQYPKDESSLNALEDIISAFENDNLIKGIIEGIKALEN